MRRMPAWSAVALASLVSPLAVADSGREVLEAVARCAQIADAKARLDCFDAAAARATSVLSAPPPPAAESGKSLLEWFGLAQPAKPVTKPEEFGKPPQPPESQELQQISANVIEFAKTARGKAVFVLDNGQVWRQFDSDGTELLPPADGKTMRVTIERGALGSYNLTIAGRNGLVKVSRIR